MDIITIFYSNNIQNIEIPKAVFENRIAFLPMMIQEKLLSYRRWQDRQAGLVGKILLVNLLRHLSVATSLGDLTYTQFNKPLLPWINFNISHSGNYVVCAASRACSVGIDIECMNPISIYDFKEQMTVNEWSRVQNSKDAKKSFYQYWTQKESVLKADGKGLSMSLKDFEIEGNKTILENKVWFVKEIPMDKQYMCHLAADKEIKNIEICSCNNIIDGINANYLETITAS